MDEFNDLINSGKIKEETSSFQGLSEELISVVGDVILEFKKAKNTPTLYPRGQNKPRKNPLWQYFVITYWKTPICVLL